MKYNHLEFLIFVNSAMEKNYIPLCIGIKSWYIWRHWAYSPLQKNYMYLYNQLFQFTSVHIKHLLYSRYYKKLLLNKTIVPQKSLIQTFCPQITTLSSIKFAQLLPLIHSLILLEPPIHWHPCLLPLDSS